jgi:hypothetical protein
MSCVSICLGYAFKTKISTGKKNKTKNKCAKYFLQIHGQLRIRLACQWGCINLSTHTK